MRQLFTTAYPGAVIGNKAFEFMAKKGLTKRNTVFAQSSCPDELNHDHYGQDLPRVFREKFGEVFHLGGLAGVPFTGKTGWGAFSHHVTDDGNIFLFFAPHVGVTKDGVVGKCNRPGQKKPSTACGAAVGAFKGLKAGGKWDTKKPFDFQQQYLTKMLAKSFKDVNSQATANEKMAALSYETYKIAEEYLHKIIGTKWMKSKASKFFILGGIMINTDGDSSDLFVPLSFDMMHADGKRHCVMKEAFGEFIADYAHKMVGKRIQF